MATSTRRLRLRPSSDAFENNGAVSPRPSAVRRPAATPRDCRYADAARARRSDSAWLYESEPTLSACPTIVSDEFGYFCRLVASASRLVRAVGSSTSESYGK